MVTLDLAVHATQVLVEVYILDQVVVLILDQVVVHTQVLAVVVITVQAVVEQTNGIDLIHIANNKNLHNYY
jgi:hypothetical protein